MQNLTKLLIIFFTISLFNYSPVYGAASTSGNDGNNYSSFYKQGKKLVLRAKKLENKNKNEKAKKLYLKAIDKLEKSYEKNKKDANILNYLGYSLRKTGSLEKAEIFYLKGLEVDALHLGINEYLGELYVQTNRIELAIERLSVLNGCKCEEYEELKKLIENK